MTQANVKLSKADAVYRVALLRIVRSAGWMMPNDATVSEIEGQVRLIAVSAPGNIARGVEQLFEKAEKNQQRAVRTTAIVAYNHDMREADEYRYAAGRVLKLFGIEWHEGDLCQFRVGVMGHTCVLSALREATKASP